MSKRAQSQNREEAALKQGARPEHVEADDEAGEFEDDYEDEFDEEIFEAGVDGRPDDEREAEESMGMAESLKLLSSLEKALMPDISRFSEQMQIDNQTFIPGRNKLSAGEILEPDESAYEMLHRLEPPWPCLSFDIIRDHLGEGRARKKYPATVYSVAGTQAASGHEKENEIMIMKMSKLSRIERPDESSDEEDEDSDNDENSDPILETKRIRLNTATNRIRAYQTPPVDTSLSSFSNTLTAALMESGEVLIHDITPHLTSFDTPGTIITPQQNKPIYTIKSHQSTEGFALDWSPHHAQRRLLTGDTAGRIHLTTQNTQDGSWSTESSRPFTGHTSSVEELQFSPGEVNVFASASADGTIRIWDVRSKTRKPAISVQASETDINVLSWSRQTNNLLASGADDGTWAVWDLRSWKPSVQKGKIGPGGMQQHDPIASFSFHKEQITSLEWHQTDDSIVSVCAGDNTLTLWDLSVELDDEESKYTADVKDIPPQLLFVHYMEQVKEAHWHPQLPGVVMATGGSGFGVFKTISV